MGRVAHDLAHILPIRCHPTGNTLSLTRGVPEYTATQLLREPSSAGAFLFPLSFRQMIKLKHL